MRKPRIADLKERSTIWANNRGEIIYIIDVNKQQIDYHPGLPGRRARRSALHTFHQSSDRERIRRKWEFVGYL